ncbi:MULTISPECIES: 4-hydroxythreonine-4-phosphate dehydrogenase PdxA [Legionella]|uniref:4-hydroxythreonine-4-phosphate dehydrogenase PdxA n=1 Tax=Legionella TaxID=445 RepID=UPI000F8DC4B7|nr:MULTISPECIES: 4-hydroxythreonine-4-phosphate dehydrogenase PdxA [Legionella]MCP0913794.1 4-hydroxythreonine-4-phosphate dehydrogenase PdxA [Legionella sp. 27cVA30]RUQ96427.1 4-hydroxythreonine-4-phosphate dehydrogenase PdxA [Legionella septentrionalis]
MKPLLVSSGEPAGIGPDLCLSLAGHELPIVVIGDKALLAARARQLGLALEFFDYQEGILPEKKPNSLTVWSFPCKETPSAGVLNSQNAPYVLDMLGIAVQQCLKNEFSALITAPVHKGIINQAGYSFTGHTEFLAAQCQAKAVVMMLACPVMRVALATTHLPLKDVAASITMESLIEIISCLHTALKRDFAIENPKIYVAGLNPHAGEGGYLGNEEIKVIVPALRFLQEKGLAVFGPFPADTLFTTNNIKECDAFLTMYHDQGLPVLKYAGFGCAVNITLGLPIIRTSVDHGTALELAGTGKADDGSLKAAVETAAYMAKQRTHL